MKREYYLNALICLLLLRVVMLGGSLADAATLAAFAIYLAITEYIKVKRWKNDAEDLIRHIDQLHELIAENKQKHEKQMEEMQNIVQVVSAKVDQVKMGVSLTQGIRK